MTSVLFVPKGAQHDQQPTNQAVSKLGTVPGVLYYMSHRLNGTLTQSAHFAVSAEADLTYLPTYLL